MFINVPLVTIIFRLLNFALLIGFFVYIFKRYIYQNISDQIAEKESFIHGLIQNNKVLEEQQHDLEMRITQQESKCKELVQKTMLWQQAVTQEKQAWTVLQDAVIRDRAQRVKLQQESLEKDRLKRVVLPHVLTESQKKLQQEFESPQAGQAFIADIIAQLRKGIS